MSGRRQHIHDARELGLDAFGRDPLRGQVLAEPALQCGPVHVTGLLERLGGLVQVVARQLTDPPVTQADPFFFQTPRVRAFSVCSVRSGHNHIFQWVSATAGAVDSVHASARAIAAGAVSVCLRPHHRLR